MQNLNEYILSLPVERVVFFRIENGKYVTEDGIEITTEFLLMYEHIIYHDCGYVMLDRRTSYTDIMDIVNNPVTTTPCQ